ncbi:hypothetical protein LXA43DRAFT_999769 [Ganoderma leucocontextum]|nr:hypothetical protein LXA43DRAFT_999769 [Ganoderma leucocontextum]
MMPASLRARGFEFALEVLVVAGVVTGSLAPVAVGAPDEPLGRVRVRRETPTPAIPQLFSYSAGRTVRSQVRQMRRDERELSPDTYRSGWFGECT